MYQPRDFSPIATCPRTYKTLKRSQMTRQVDDSEVTGPNAYVKVEALNTVPGKLRGVVHVFARQVSLLFPIIRGAKVSFEVGRVSKNPHVCIVKHHLVEMTFSGEAKLASSLYYPVCTTCTRRDTRRSSPCSASAFKEYRPSPALTSP